MLLILWLGLYVVGGSLLLLPLALWLREIYRQYSGTRAVTCPESQQEAAVSIDARHAAATGMNGYPELRLCDCTRWPERASCDKGCLSEAVRTQPYAPGEVKLRTKKIYHLPILVAAFAAWYVGAIWHSQYLFRTRWMDAVGLTRTEIKQMVWWLSPHLLTAAICLLFAYGVAWLLAVCHRKGVLPGVLMAVLLWGALAVASGYGLVKLPHDLLMIEAAYTGLAAIMVGSIVGGLYDRLVLREE